MSTFNDEMQECLDDVAGTFGDRTITVTHRERGAISAVTLVREASLSTLTAAAHRVEVGEEMVAGPEGQLVPVQVTEYHVRRLVGGEAISFIPVSGDEVTDPVGGEVFQVFAVGSKCNGLEIVLRCKRTSRSAALK